MIDLTLSSEEDSPPKRRRVSSQTIPLARTAAEPNLAPDAGLPAILAAASLQPLPRPAVQTTAGPAALAVGPSQPPAAAPPRSSPGPRSQAPHDARDAVPGPTLHDHVGTEDVSAAQRAGRRCGLDPAAPHSRWQLDSLYQDDGHDPGPLPDGTAAAGGRQEEAIEAGGPPVEVAEARGADTTSNPGPDDDDEAPAKKKRGGGKRLTAEEKAQRQAAKEAEQARRKEERERLKAEKEERKAAEKQLKELEKAQKKQSKENEKAAAKQQKEAGNALKTSMVGRYMRLLMSNSLAVSPLGSTMVDLLPRLRTGRDQVFPHEVHRNLPLAAKGYRYCMWGLRLPHAAAAKLQACEGCALEASDLADPDKADGLPLLLFPALLLLQSGDDLITRLLADPQAPLSSLHDEVLRAHPGASLLVYVTGLEEALRRRERANKSFSRASIEDLLFDVTVGMPAVRLQYDCPETDLTRAATDVLNLGWALSQAPRKRADAYLEHFGSKSTVPLRAIKDVLAEQGGQEQLTLCDALSQLVAPQRAAAIAAEYPSLAAIMEALRAKPEGGAQRRMACCRIPGVVPGKHRQQFAGPAAAASVARFLQWQDGRQEWKEEE